MKRAVASLAIVLLILVAGVRPAQAASIPIINVGAFGIEVCPQFFCHVAIFAGILQGQVDSNDNAFGTFVVAITHEDLPPPFQFADITGGGVELRIGLRRIQGIVLPGGKLFNNNDNTFGVGAVLVLTSPGTSGFVIIRGLLNHNTPIPTVVATLTQQ